MGNGELVVTFGLPATAASVSLSSPAVKVSPTLAQKAKQHRDVTLGVTVWVIPTSGPPGTLPFSVKDPT